MDVGYQNQSTALILGGDNIRVNGHGVGTLNGNGDYWYEYISEQEKDIVSEIQYPHESLQRVVVIVYAGADDVFSTR